MTGVLLVAAAACSREVRHHVLTFFYDGVPPLDAGTAEPDAGASDTGQAVTVGAPASETERPRFYNHPAFWRNLCAECHEGSGGGLLKTVREGLCQTCHPNNPPKKKFVHGPVAVNGCLACHRYHRSRYPKVLVTDAQSLCYLCHVNEELILGKHHETIEEKRCIDCHDAHGGDDRFFLLPGVADEAEAADDSS
jgi:predicted CXXCH cytochrome family protein